MTQDVKIIGGIGIITLAIVIGSVFLLGKSSPTVSATKVDQALLLGKNAYVIGNKNAKVTIVEFGDYQCPACATAYPVTKQLLKDYNGKIKLVFRNFPIPEHQNELAAAESAEAAGSQGKFWQMHDLLYSNQDSWGESTHAMDYFLKYAKKLKLNMTKFQSDVTGSKYASNITRDQADAEKLGVNFTPTFYVNGEVLSTDATYDNLQSAIDAAMK